MKSLIIYGSTTGNSKLVASRVPKLLQFKSEVIDVKSITQPSDLLEYDLLLFIASTWGDGELQLDMEIFLQQSRIDLNRKSFAICELGNYYGYDDFEFGALNIMQSILESWNGREIMEPFSMDSLPHKDWKNLGQWCEKLNSIVAQQHE